MVGCLRAGMTPGMGIAVEGGAFELLLDRRVMNRTVMALHRLQAGRRNEKKRQRDQDGLQCAHPIETAAVGGHLSGSVPPQPKRRLMKLKIVAISAPA